MGKETTILHGHGYFGKPFPHLIQGNRKTPIAFGSRPYPEQFSLCIENPRRNRTVSHRFERDRGPGSIQKEGAPSEKKHGSKKAPPQNLATQR